MKVVYLNPSGQLGGAESALLDLMASVRAAEPAWQLHLVMGADGPLATRAHELGVDVSVLPFPPDLASLGDAGSGGPAGAQTRRTALISKLLLATPSVIRYVGELRQALRGIQADLVHTNGFKMHVLGVRALPHHNVPVIWHVRDYVGLRPLMARLLRWHTSGCAAIVTNSKSVASDVRAVCGDDVEIHPVLDAIDLDVFSPTGATIDLDTRASLPQAENGTIRVGLLATMARWKGHETFLRALSLVPESANVRGYIIGGALYQTEGSQHSLSELKNLAVQLGVHEKVGFTGFVEDPASAIRALDIVVHASTQPEPFGLVIVEAMACGRALVASNAGGAAEIITPGKDALGHQPGDFKELAACILKLAADPSLRERLGESGHIKAREQFDRARLASELIPIYQEALSRKN
jgi:glycosyltransferase involved in cell wall biosynthesis